MKTQLLIPVILSLSSAISVFAQPHAPTIEWSRTYGGHSYDGCYDIKRLNDGGFVFAGSTWSFGNGGIDDFWLVRTDSNGDSLWSRTFGVEGDDFCWSLDLTSDGGFILGGGTVLFGGQGLNCWIIKTDMNGDSLWSRVYAGPNYDVVTAIRQVPDGGSLVCGLSSWLDSTRRRAFVMKLDSVGDSLWCRPYGGAGVLRSLVSIGDGSSVAAGYETNDISGRVNAWLLRLDANGDSLWSRRYTVGNNHTYFTSVILTVESEIVGFGYIGNSSAGGCDFFLVKTNLQGDTLWTRTYGSPISIDEGTSVIQTEDDGFVLAGQRLYLSGGGSNIWIVRTDALGNALWETEVGGDENDQGATIISTSDGGYLLGADTDSYGAGWTDAWLVKFSPEQAAPSIRAIQDTCSILNYPNPFNDATNVVFYVPRESALTLDAYNILGRRMGRIANSTFSAGQHAISWNCHNCPSGEYFLRLYGDGLSTYRKVLLLR